MADDPFTDAYRMLNEKQKAAVDTIEGPVMVIAGPGTGKTQILTLRIANILKQTDTEPENILALTFTESGGVAMRKRLRTYIGAQAYRVTITTFHSFCSSIIQEHPESFPRIIGAAPIHAVDQITLIQELLDEYNPELLRPYGDPYLYAKDIIRKIEELKREGLSPEAYAELVVKEKAAFEADEEKYHQSGAHAGKMKGEYKKYEKMLRKNEELADLYAAYHARLFERRVYDYSDLIMEVLQAFEEDDDLLLLVQEQYQYVLVDEHQDTNRAQNTIIEQLMSFHEFPNIFIVGDEKQAIFRFQGASLENFNYFRTRYSGATLITLTQNYRSTQTILNSAESLLGGSLAANIDAPDRPIAHAVLEHQSEEPAYVAYSVQSLLAEGVRPGEVAILYRKNSDAADISRVFEKLGIPYVVESDYDLLAEPDVQKILHVLRAIDGYGDEYAISEALHVDCFAIEPIDIYRLMRAARESRHTIYEMLTREELPPLAKKDRVLDFSRMLKRWVQVSKNQSLSEAVETIIRESGLIEQIIGDRFRTERLNVLQQFLSEVARIETAHPGLSLTDLFTYLDALKRHNLFVRQIARSSRDDRVRLMTAHRSKGLEFAHVFLTGALDGVFGGRRNRDRLPLLPAVYKAAGDETTDDDERRLFYVALTRAKEHAHITGYTYNTEGREMTTSKFVAEIKESLIETIDTTPFYDWYEENRSTLLVGQSQTQESKIEASFVRELFDEHGLSVTALNNYLACPWRYFYRNLLRLPEVMPAYAKYGTAVHAALHDFFVARTKEAVGKEYLIASFKQHLGAQGLDQPTYDDLVARGTDALSGYYDTRSASFPEQALAEFRINGVLLDDDILLRGALDRIDLQSESRVSVTDYKTKRPMSRNEILGATKSSTGDYHRQLVFYKLLLRLYNDNQYEMEHGVIDFIEPNDRGVYKYESFAIGDEDVAELQETIRRVAEEIRTLGFWDQRCDEADCQYCTLRSFLDG